MIHELPHYKVLLLHHFQPECPCVRENGGVKTALIIHPIRLLIRGCKTISIIGATMFNIDATRIHIVFAKIGGVCYGVLRLRGTEVKWF